MQMPKSEREVILMEQELSGFLGQTHISERNISRIRQVTQHPNARVAMFGAAMLDVVLSAPILKRRGGGKSIEMTEEICSEVCARWEAASAALVDDKTGEQGDASDSSPATGSEPDDR
jgi:hypothetical protein